MDKKKQDTLFMIIAVLMGFMALLLKAYVNFYCYQNILRQSFPNLPDLSILNLYVITLAIGTICYSFKPSEEKTPLQHLDIAFKRLFSYLFALALVTIVKLFI